jgi:hypothetical protein
MDCSGRPTPRVTVCKVGPAGTRSIAHARILGEVGLARLLGAREGLSVGMRFAILGFSHKLSLKLTRRGHLALGLLDHL